MIVSPALSFILFSTFITMQPAEQPGEGGTVWSPPVQQAHPWMKKALRPHILEGS
jgi:hypothetical protein